MMSTMSKQVDCEEKVVRQTEQSQDERRLKWYRCLPEKSDEPAE